MPIKYSRARAPCKCAAASLQQKDNSEVAVNKILSTKTKSRTVFMLVPAVSMGTAADSLASARAVNWSTHSSIVCTCFIYKINNVYCAYVTIVPKDVSFNITQVRLPLRFPSSSFHEEAPSIKIENKLVERRNRTKMLRNRLPVRKAPFCPFR